MRTGRVFTVMIVGLMLFGVGCSQQVTGTAQRDPQRPPTAVSADGFGIVTGYPDAPVQIELFTEPQCSHCADLQADFGRDLERYIDLGQLAVTYRPLIFLDTGPDGQSARVSNAMFLAAGPQTTATAFQMFVEDLWSHQDRGGRGPSDEQLADMAAESGVGADAVDKIAAGEQALDVQEMGDINFEFLYGVDLLDVGTPTVFDLVNEEKVDIYDDNWLAKLVSSV